MARLRLTPPKDPVFSVELPVRVTDLNYGRHLGHMELVGLMHEARVRFLRSIGMTELDVDGAALLVVDLAVSYRSEAFLGDVLAVDLGLRPEGSRGAEMNYGIRKVENDAVVALGRTGVVFRDLRSGRLEKIPPCFLRLIEEQR